MSRPRCLYLSHHRYAIICYGRRPRRCTPTPRLTPRRHQSSFHSAARVASSPPVSYLHRRHRRRRARPPSSPSAGPAIGRLDGTGKPCSRSRTGRRGGNSGCRSAHLHGPLTTAATTTTTTTTKASALLLLPLLLLLAQQLLLAVVLGKVEPVQGRGPAAWVEVLEEAGKRAGRRGRGPSLRGPLAGRWPRPALRSGTSQQVAHLPHELDLLQGRRRVVSSHRMTPKLNTSAGSP